MRRRKECACRTISKVLTNLSLKLVSKFQKAGRYNLSLFSVFINFLSLNKFDYWRIPTFFLQAGITCSNSRAEAPQKIVNSFQSQQERHENDINNVVLLSLWLTLNIFHLLFWCFPCWLRTSKCPLSIWKKWL